MEWGGHIVQAMQCIMHWLEIIDRMNLFARPNFSDQDLLIMCNEAMKTDPRFLIIIYVMNYYMIFRAMVISDFAIFLHQKFN